VPPGKNLCRPPGGRSLPPDATLLADPLFHAHRLANHTLLPGAMQCRDPLVGPIAWRTYTCRQALYQ